MRLRRMCLFVIAVILLAPARVSTAHPAIQSGDPALQRCTPSSAATAPAATQQSTQAAAPASNDQPALFVVTTVAPITNLAFNIGGSHVKVYGLIPEGVNSHTFEPKPSDAARLSNADVIFVNGLHLEEPTLKLAQANMKSGAELVELAPKAIQEQDWAYDFSFPKAEGNPNPHLWINPLLALRYAKTMEETFARRDPAHADAYKANYDILAGRIQILDQAICDSTASIPEKQRKLLTYHDSFAYFAPRYGMEVLGAIQPADFSEPSAQEVARLIDQIKAEGVPAIFGSEVFPSPVLDQIGKEAGVKYISTLADDDLPNQTDNRLFHSYLQLMVNDVTTMTSALGGDPSPLKAVDTANIPGPDDSVESAS